ncbi:MAG: hypothetical protein GXP42_05760 [Chloroflexi bacterium]|nr:hypothetical protein [Chloroflexota bacterium]
MVRPRLLRKIEAALSAGHVLITAPAGYGKTVLLRSLSAHRPHSFYTRLTPADADLSRLQEKLGPAQRSARGQSFTALLLDDVHHLQEGSETVEWLLEQANEEAFHLVMAGRWAPTAVLSSRAARGEWLHLDARDLAFTLTESQALLESFHARTSAQTWHERTNGWPLALALLSRMNAAPDPHAPAKAELFTYLAHTLANDLPPDLLHFWTVSAIPLRFNDELTAHLLDASTDVRALRKEVRRRNLFLEPADEPGWFRYHELIREFLVRRARAAALTIHRRAIAWFEARGDLEAAIEQALDADLHETAARLILALPERFVWDNGRFRTYRRWVYALDRTTREANPELLIRLGTYLLQQLGMRAEAHARLQEALHLAQQNNDALARRRVLGRMARLHYRDGDAKQALTYAQALLDDPECQGQERLDALYIAAPALGDLTRFRDAQQAYLEAIRLAKALDKTEEEMLFRTNLAITVLIPRGRFAASQRHIQASLDYFRDSPGRCISILLQQCEIHAAKGDWDGLASVLQQVEDLMAELEVQNVSHLLWRAYYQGVLFTGRGLFDDARHWLKQTEQVAKQHPLALVCLAWLESWLLRREGRYEQAVGRAETTLAQPLEAPFYRAILALERDIALAMQAWQDPSITVSLHPETRNLIRWRARADLVRLRALLSICSHNRRDGRLLHHLRATLRALDHPGYENLLTHRDPELGAHFWSLALAQGEAPDRALAALQIIGDPDPVSQSLAHNDPAVRARAAQALAAIGREQAMPALANALANEQDPTAAAAMNASLLHLESRPPPPLRVQVLGEFALWRDGRLVPAQAWHRPVVRRLFQYFALHRGQPLPRDRILDDLWPHTEPRKAWAAFRTTYSKLRPVLDPYTRPKSGLRYVAVKGATYRFDPHDVVQVDAEILEAKVRETLKVGGASDIPPIDEDFLAALEAWKPLLPQLPYEEWLLEPRERLQNLYVEGCLYAAEAMLVRGRAVEAETWALRTVEAAAWLEEGWQALMRAYARQGKRTLALKAYEKAVEALKQELAVEPSDLTRWLAARVKRGQGI